MTTLHTRTQKFERLETRRMLASTTDARVAEQYALDAIDVSAAWATTTGSATTIVAGIDTGADYTHEDLYRNVYVNQAEIPGNVRKHVKDTDKDGLITFDDLNSRKNRRWVTDANANGTIDAGDLLRPTSEGGWEDGVNGQSNANDTYVDDIVGWDFAEGDNDPFDDGTANEGHGTHTAGIVGATGDNGVGITGVAQQVSLMLVRIFADDGSAADDATIAEAIRYSADSGAQVSNNSWGGSYGYAGDLLYDAISYAGDLGQLFVVAAGNDGRNLDSARYNSYPAEYALDNIVVVAATDADGTIASYSNYGATTVDVAAPGTAVLSTLPGNAYGSYSGTSMATPVVSGAAALMLSADPTLTVADIKTRLIDGSDETTALSPVSVSQGVVNVVNAVLGVAGVDVADVSIPVEEVYRRPPRRWAAFFAGDATIG